MSSAADSKQPGWLFGPLPDILLGCGVGYLCLIAVFALAGDSLGDSPVGLLALVTLLVSAPHYGATLLRVYEQRTDRRTYARVAVWATIAIALLFVVGVREPFVAMWMFTIYSTWSPWHYTGQNYGLCLMMLGRRGVEMPPTAKRLLHLSFVSSFLITFMVLHGSTQASGYVPNPTDYGSPRVAFVSLGIPNEFARWVLALATFVHAGTLLGALGMLSRRTGWSALGPASAIVVTQIMWFSLPFSLRFWGIETGIDPLDGGLTSDFVVWTAVGHAVQYLWVTSYFAKAQTSFTSFPRYFAKVLCAGTAIWALPGVLFAGQHLGRIGSTDGLLLLIAAGVNLHHFILDGAIWKLRSRRVANVLIRSTREEAGPEAVPSRPWLRYGVWSLCAVGTATAFTTAWLEHGVFMPSIQAGDTTRSREALDWTARAGREFPELRLALAKALRSNGELDAASEQLEQILALRPTREALRPLLAIHTSRGDWDRVIAQWEAYIAEAPFDPMLAAQAVQAHYALGQRSEARELFDQALAITGRTAKDYSRFGDLAYGQGDLETAIRYYRAALEIEPERHAAANNLAWILATADDDTLRNGSEALRLAERVVAASTTPDPNHLDTLAAALASTGRYDEAVDSAQQALEIAEARSLDAMADGLRKHLARYRAGHALHEALPAEL
jgi:tetratricopeptide (TPR) repeat protein